MRLLTYDPRGDLYVTEEFADDVVPPYAILSHTWGSDDQEVKLHEVGWVSSRAKAGHRKIEFCGQQSQRDGLKYFWVDTCCIDKTNHVELSTAITCMYRWYQRAQVCYVYLADVSSGESDDDTTTDNHAIKRSWKPSFCKSRWFTRGWTLQELLAPKEVVFYSKEGDCLGAKSTLKELLHEITTIPIAALDGQPVSQFPVIERMRWTRDRVTKQKEDEAYCLLGIFNVFLPLIYGEGDNAFRRLQKEIDAQRSNESSGNILNNPHGSPGVRSLGLCLASAPLIQPDEFVGRTAEIDAIHHILQPDETSLGQQRAVLGGMGGIGKTQLAIAYARHYRRSYATVLWLNATSEQTLYASLQLFAQALIASNELEQLDNKRVLVRIQEWLCQPHNTRWLLIFDNYDDPDLFDLDRFYPPIGHGSIIVTTRRPNMVSGSQVRVPLLTDINDSLDVLQMRSGRKNVRTDVGARQLAERLAGFPLALATAGVYLRKTTITFQQYRDSYEQRWQVDARRPVRIQDYDRSLYTTWNVSYSQLQISDPRAAQMLRLMAYFDRQEVWYDLCVAGLSNHSSAWLRACLVDQSTFESVMGTLVEYCLIEVQCTTQSYGMHGCIHDWTLGALNAEVDAQLYWYVFDCVAAWIDRNYDRNLDQVSFNRVTRHAVHLLDRRFESCAKLPSYQLERLDEAGLIGHMLRHQFQLSAAEQMYIRTLAGLEELFGPNHPSTLSTVRCVGRVYCNQGRLVESEQMFMRALTGFQKAYGPNHPETLTMVHDLAFFYHKQQKLDKVEHMYIRALLGLEKALEPEDIRILSVVRKLGAFYIAQDNFEAAESLLTRALVGYEKKFGPNDTAIFQVNYLFGLLYQRQRKLIEAEQMYVRALVGMEKMLGPGHLFILNIVNALGILYGDQGKLFDAEQMLMRVVTHRTKSLGPRNENTLRSMRALKLVREKIAAKENQD